MYLIGGVSPNTSRVWCAPAHPARTARREPAPPNLSCWRAAACTWPSTGRSAVCHLCREKKAGVAGQPEQSCQLDEAGRGCGWPRLEAALSLIWRWRGVSKLEGDVAEASGRLFSTWRTAAAV
eukprot:scaffold79374_cov72-Phaeocystis_antarctica.AAC.4